MQQIKNGKCSQGHDIIFFKANILSKLQSHIVTHLFHLPLKKNAEPSVIMTENGHTDCQQLFNLIIIITVFSL